MTSHDDKQGYQLMMLSIGHCVMQWAQVELHLALLFHTLFGTDREAADLFWGRIRSFDAKLQLINDLAGLRILDANHKRDWGLLRSHTATLYKKRNQVAHSTAIDDENKKAAIEPFLVPFTRAPRTLSYNDVTEYAKEFLELSEAVLFFNMSMVAALQQIELPKPEPDLLLRLRKQDAQNREAQRHRVKAWRLYLQQNPDLKLD